MREILFKAKRIDNGEWVEGFYVNYKNVIHYILACDGNGFVWYEIEKDTICQYTGLTDKNGNKIWENDVVKKHFYTDYDAFANSEEYIGRVEYLDCAWCIRWKRDDYMVTVPIFMALSESHDAEHYEVIANFFDNPEL